VVKHFGMHHLVRNGAKASQVDYTLDPIQPEAVGKVETRDPAKATSTELRGLHICIDAGHGGKDMGGEAFGIQEKTIALAVSLMLRDLCEAAGAKVTMTRTTDVYPELDKRVEIANSCGCQLFLSVHANIAPNSNEVDGFEAFYNANSASGQSFAKSLVAAYDTFSQAPNRGAKKDPRGLRVLEKTKVTAVLFELGFLSNEAEGKRLAKKNYQQAMAKALFDGIVGEWSKKASVSR
jgi:N-acetylmuramoyl-L-alanine amidase